MFNRPALAITCALLFGSCAGDSAENPKSEPAEPVVEFSDILPPDVNEGWPCPPFTSFETTLENTGDDDGDNILDCQELFLGSNPNNPDSDGDWVNDFIERGNLTAALDNTSPDNPGVADGILDAGEGLDTDGDGILDIIDPDDDGDGIPTAEEDSAVDGFGNGNMNPLDDDLDADGTRNYLDPDNEGDFVYEVVEDFYAGNGDGDPRNDDFDGDGIMNYVDTDDDGDGADGCEDDGDGVVDGSQFDRQVGVDGDGKPIIMTFFEDDADLDGVMNFMDLDDDGDGILTENEDWNTSGNACDDDVDDDGIPDFRDLEDDGDTVLSLDEDLNGNSILLDDDTDGDLIPNFRDTDDDGDSVPSVDERPRGGGPDARDTDRDGVPDYLDTDDDNDGFSTDDEVNDGSGGTTYNNPDDDGDGCPTAFEPSTRLDPDTKPAGCEYYNLTIAASGLDKAYYGARVYFLLTNADGFVGITNGVVSDAGDLAASFPLLLEVDVSHTLDYFVDVNEDGSCAAEASFRRSSVVAATDPKSDDLAVTVDLVTDANSLACDQFP